MSVKKHVAATSDGLFESIDQILIEKGISTPEFPLSVKKLQLELDKNPNLAIAGNNLDEARCIKWGRELRKMIDPHTKKEIVQLVKVCIQRG